MPAVAATTAPASASSPATGTTSTPRPRAVTRGPSVAVVGAGATPSSAVAHGFGVLHLAEEPQRDVPLIGRRPAHARRFGPIQRRDLGQEARGRDDGHEQAHPCSVRLRTPRAVMIGVMTASRATLIARDR